MFEISTNNKIVYSVSDFFQFLPIMVINNFFIIINFIKVVIKQESRLIQGDQTYNYMYKRRSYYIALRTRRMKLRKDKRKHSS